MSWVRTTGIAILALALLPAAAEAAARTPASDPEATAQTRELVEKLAMLGEVLGTVTPLFPTAVFGEAFEAALPSLPSGDGRDWETSVGFDFKTDVTTGTLEADEESRAVLTDARACVDEGLTAEIVHFSRFTRGAVRGHRCIIVAQSEGVWMLQSKTFAEGPDRRLTAYYGVATVVEGQPDEARRLLEERLDQNVALAGTLADYALEMFLNSQVGADPDEEAFAARVARMTERLAEVAASLEEPDAGSPSVPDAVGAGD